MSLLRSPSGGKGFHRLLAAGIGLSLALVSIEVASRAHAGWPAPVDWFQFDALLGHRMKPWNSVHAADDAGVFADSSNAEGFRSIPIPDESSPAPDGNRLLVLGDSFVRAYEIRNGDRFSEVAADRSGSDWEVHHICSDDWSNGQQLLALREYGGRIRPDVVVLAMFPGNDIVTNHEVFAGQDPGSPSDYFRPYVAPRSRDGASGGFEVRYAHPLRGSLRRHSSAFAWIERRLVQSGRWSPFPGIDARRPESPWNLRDQLFCPPEDDSGWNAAWDRTEFVLASLAQECAALGARFGVLVIPTIFQVEQTGLTLAAQLDLLFQPRATAYSESDFELPERRLAGIFERQGIEWMQTLDALRTEARNTQRVMYLKNGHLNARGHEVAGRVLARWLRGEDVPDHEPVTHGPARLLPMAPDGPTWLDFTKGSQERFTCVGFGARRPGGWLDAPERMAPVDNRHCRFVVRVDEGDMGIEGVAAPWAALPIPIELHAFGHLLATTRIEEPGPFELTWDSDLLRVLDLVPAEKRPYVQFHLLFPPGDLPPVGIRGVGFLSGRGDTQERPSTGPDSH